MQEESIGMPPLNTDLSWYRWEHPILMHPRVCVGTSLLGDALNHGKGVCSSFDSSLKWEPEQRKANSLETQHVSAFLGASSGSRTWGTYRDGPPTEHQQWAVWHPNGRRRLLTQLVGLTAISCMTSHTHHTPQLSWQP